MHNLTPLSGLLGGALIGLAAAMLMLLTGRIAGISGIFGGLLVPGAKDRDCRIAFVAGLIAAPLIASFVTGAALPSPAMPASLIVIVVAGLLVGFGSRMGGGCTSGHGVCGVARLSARSLIATAIFMTAAIVTVAIARHIIGG
ncbi:MAG: YeeE/YedE family protein [Pseudomonadota bacterium]